MLPWRMIRRRYQRPATVAGSVVALLFLLHLLFSRGPGFDDGEPRQPELIGISLPPGPLLNGHLFFSLIVNTGVCGKHGNRPVYALLLVASRPAHFEHRKRLRDFYALEAVRASWHPRIVRLVFLLAVDIKDESLQTLVYDESSEHRDIIQEDYADDALTPGPASRITMTGFKWALEHCKAARFIVRMSDAVVVNPPRLVATLTDAFGGDGDGGQQQHGSSTGRAIVCRQTASAAPAERLAAGRGSAAVEPARQTSSHCDGDAYIVTYDMMRHLFAAYQYTPYAPEDGPYVTGLLRQQVHGARLLQLPASASFGSVQVSDPAAVAESILASEPVFLHLPPLNVTIGASRRRPPADYLAYD